MATPSRRVFLSAKELERTFARDTIARGVRYASQGRVRDARWSNDGLTLTAVCAGSDDNEYRVTTAFAEVGVGYTLNWSACTCPVGQLCKHMVAVLLTSVLGDPPPPAVDRWRTIVSNLVDEGATAARTESANLPIGVEFSLVQSTLLPGHGVSIRPVTMGKRGSWVKTALTWGRLLHNPNPGEFDRHHYLAVRAVADELQRSGPMPLGSPMLISSARATFWSRLDDAVDAGVTIVADGATGLDAVDFVKASQLRLQFDAADDGGAVMSVALYLDGERCDPNGFGVVGMPAPHGIYVVDAGVLRLGRFDPVPGPTALGLITRGERVQIPADGLPEFELDILPLLAEAAPVESADGLFVAPDVDGPTPVLTLTRTDRGVRASWGTRYHVNGEPHDLEPDSTRRVGYRDVDAEEIAWGSVGPALRAVAEAARNWRTQATGYNLRRMLNAARANGQSALDGIRGAQEAASRPSPDTWRAPTDLTLTEAALLCGETLPHLDCRAAFLIEFDEDVPDFRAAASDPQVEFSSGLEAPARNDWFDLDVTIAVDGHQLPISAVIAELASGATHMLLPNGVYFRLDTPQLQRLRLLLEEARALGEIDSGKAKGASFNPTLWTDLLDLGVVDAQLATWRNNLALLSAARPPVPVGSPDGLDATLREYQCDGLDWLSFLWDNGLGGVLADDMGLGKTVQTLALIARVVDDEPSSRFLVVAPTSVVANWVAECRKFTPGLTVAAVTSTERRSGTLLADVAADAHIVVTSYALLRIDFEAYSRLDWAGAVFDEAQFVKNHNSKTHQCARRLDARFKLAITGTPMENNLMELWSLLSITAPGLFPSQTAFTEYFRKPIESGNAGGRLAVLRRRIKPVMLRRTKSQVAAELPPKQEQVLHLELGAKHRKIYDTLLARERQKILGLLGEWDTNKFQVFRSLTLLRQLSLHAGLVDETNGDVASAKVDFLADQLPELIGEGHNALVFSQFTRFLAIIRARLDAAGVSYSYLDGSSSPHAREAAVHNFRTGLTQVFLISLKAGGFGLNLTEADFCFVTDPWWNPAAEAQAVDRAHRIGQTRPVNVYRLVSSDTIEEKVLELQERKRALFDAVIEEGDVFASGITESDVRALFT